MLKFLIKLFAPAVCVYLLNILLLKLGVYEAFPDIDIALHTMGGMAIAYMGIMLWRTGLGYPKGTLSSIPAPIVFLTILGFVGLVGIAWEWHEFIIDAFATAYHLDFVPAQPGVGDTMADLFFDLLGGGVVTSISLVFFGRKN